MKSPLRYQATDTDCGKTSLTNAFMYLFERSELLPQVVDYVSRVTGDCNLGVLNYYRGTSAFSLSFMADWCNDYLAKAGIPVRARALRGDEVSMAEGSALVEGLQDGAIAVCGCKVNCDHYVLMSGIDEKSVRVFDPYYEPFPPQAFKLPEHGVTWVEDAPFSHNRIVDREVFDDPHATAYTLYADSGRDAILLWRTSDEPVVWHD